MMNARWARNEKHCQTQEFICLVRQFELTLMKTKQMNGRLARNENHCQTQGIHMFTKTMLFKP